MKYAIGLALMLLPLTACGTVPFNADKKAVASIVPDVPEIPKAVQRNAADEMQSGACPSLNAIANACLITRDEARGALE